MSNDNDWASSIGYPSSPGYQKGSDTSFEAARSMDVDVKTLRGMCYRTLKEHGPLTADEVASRLDMSVLSIRPRLTELKAAGLVHDTGERRPNTSGRNAAVLRAGFSLRPGQPELEPRHPAPSLQSSFDLQA